MSVFLARIANFLGKLTILQGNISSASGVASLILAQMLNIPDTIKNLQLGRKLLMVQPWTDWSRIVLVLFVVSQTIELNPIINIGIALAAAATVLAILVRAMMLYLSKDRDLCKNMANSKHFTVDCTLQENKNRQVEKEKIKEQDRLKKDLREEYEAQIDVLERRLRLGVNEQEKSEINQAFYFAENKYRNKVNEMIKAFPTWGPKTDYSEYKKKISIWRAKHSASSSDHSDQHLNDIEDTSNDRARAGVSGGNIHPTFDPEIWLRERSLKR
ncbi:MAG: hypothetical protein VXZ73_01380 [Pseudomonadota bacterium]|nr:hypothetical protein [Pseudomonadota bacterium]